MSKINRVNDVTIVAWGKKNNKKRKRYTIVLDERKGNIIVKIRMREN